MSTYDIKKMRDQMKAKSGFVRDATEFKPPKVKPGESFLARFFVLPPLMKGDKTADGFAGQDQELWFVRNGSHWISKKPYPCPRIHDENECDLCTNAFEMMKDVPDKEGRSKIARTYLPKEQYAVNIYFPNSEVNIPDVRGKVFWYNAPKPIYDKFAECINRDDEGDPSDRKAFGAFFNEMEAYLFQLEIYEKSDFNQYDKSKFLVDVKVPIVCDRERKPVIDKITALLNLRYDLYTKFSARDTNLIKKKALEFINRDDGGGQDAGFTIDEAPSKPASQSVEKSITPSDLSGEGVPVTAKSTPKATNKVQAAPIQTPVVHATAKVEVDPVSTVQDTDLELEALMKDITG